VGELLDRDQVEDALRHQATHDLLTGLPNRAQLATALDSALDRGARGRVALLVCDIDHLKSVNDTLGHRAGEELISQVAVRLRRSVRPDDLVTRISGDEFVVVLKGVDDADVEPLCRRIIETVAQPMILGARTETTTSLSIGVALGEPGMTGEEIFNGADTALYEAKRLGRGRTVHFDDRLRREARERLQIEGDLPRALAEGHIRCLHQPEVVLATGDLFGFESLARWQHPERGLITPDRFVPAADATGNAGLLFEAVLAQTLETQRRWAAELGFHPRVAVNLSALQLDDPDLPATITRALARADAPADALWLELTETGVADASALSSLKALAALGVHLALDDFGTGWSSMSRLSQYPWELLKLDRSLIAPLGTAPDAEHVVRAMIVMAHALGIPTVAEGVETPLQLERLRNLGCDIVQGFLFSRPVAAVDAVALVDRDGRWTGHPPLAQLPAATS
jgi:diguanylate cyclase